MSEYDEDACEFDAGWEFAWNELSSLSERMRNKVFEAKKWREHYEKERAELQKLRSEFASEVEARVKEKDEQLKNARTMYEQMRAELERERKEVAKALDFKSDLADKIPAVVTVVYGKYNSVFQAFASPEKAEEFRKLQDSDRLTGRLEVKSSSVRM